MTVKEIHKLLDDQKNQRGIDNWERIKTNSWSSYGIGLTQLKKIAKTIGKNHELALILKQEENYDIQMLSFLIDEPKKATREEILHQTESSSMWMLSHVFVQNVFCKVPFAKEMAEDFRKSKNDLKRRIGYSYLYYLAKDKKISDDYFEPILNKIKQEIQQEENFVKDAMNNALFAIGQRSKLLNDKVIEIAKFIGKVTVDYGDNSCEAVDVLKHMTSERMQKKFKN